MYTEITGVTYNKEHNVAVIDGLRTEDMMLSDWDTEVTDFEVRFYFDLEDEGSRRYLTLILNSNGKKNCSIIERFKSIVGKFINLNPKFKTPTKRIEELIDEGKVA